MIMRILFLALVVSLVSAFEITDRLSLPPNEIISDLVVHDSYAYALIGASNPATVYKIDLNSMKISNVLSLPYFTYPSQPILDKTENKLYLVARNSSSIVITENLLTIDLSTFQVSSISYLSALSSLGCDQLFKSGSKFYCINQNQESCTMIRFDPKTMTPEATKKFYCSRFSMYASSSLGTPDGQYGYIGYDQPPYVVVLPNMTLQALPNPAVQPARTQKTPPSDGAMCATRDMLTLFMGGTATAFMRTNVTSNIGNGEYYVEQGRSATACLVSPDQKYVFSGYSDGSIRRADALAPSFGGGYTGVLYQFDSAILGMKLLDDQRTVLVWTRTAVLKFDYNAKMQPSSAQTLALQTTFRKVAGMTVDQEEKFAYVFLYDTRSTQRFLTYMVKYDLQQRSIVLDVNTTDFITFPSVQLYLDANQNRLLVFAQQTVVLDPTDFSVISTNPLYVGTANSYQDPISNKIVVVMPGGLIAFDIDANTYNQCNVTHQSWQSFTQLIRGPGTQAMLATDSSRPTLSLVDYATCAVKMLNFNSSSLQFKGEGTYSNGLYYLIAFDKQSTRLLLTFDPTTGDFSQIATMPFLAPLSTQLSFGAPNSYVLLPSLGDGNIWKLTLNQPSLEQLVLFAPPVASYYNARSNTAYILSSTEPPSIYKINV